MNSTDLESWLVILVCYFIRKELVPLCIVLELLNLRVWQGSLYRSNTHHGALLGVTSLLMATAAPIQHLIFSFFPLHRLLPQTLTFGESVFLSQLLGMIILPVFGPALSTFGTLVPSFSAVFSEAVVLSALALITSWSFLPAVPCFVVVVSAAYFHLQSLYPSPLETFISHVSSPSHISILGYWMICLISIPLLSVINQSIVKLPNTVNRKFFHFLSVAMFSPVILEDTQFMRLSFSIAISLFIVVESYRVLEFPGHSHLSSFMKQFRDSRDSHITLSHLFLLVGIALPVFLASSTLAQFSGIISIGIGDSFASIAGTFFGRHKWPNSSKTIEGTLASWLSMTVSVFILGQHIGVYCTQQWYMRMAGATLLTALLETFTQQFDNLFLPLFLQTLLTKLN